METWIEILAHYLAKEQAQITFPNVKLDAAVVVEGECYQALNKIKAIFKDDRLEDKECFRKIEAIVFTLESLGTHAGNRHDF